MNSIVARVRTEPVLVTAAVSAVIALVVAFGVELSNEQTGAILAVVTALLGFVTRRKVTPSAPHEFVNDEAAPMESSN